MLFLLCVYIYIYTYVYININKQTYVYTHICCYESCMVGWEKPWFCSTLALELNGHDTILAQVQRWENCVFSLAVERGYFPSIAGATGLKAGATGRHTYYHILPRRSQLGPVLSMLGCHSWVLLPPPLYIICTKGIRFHLLFRPSTLTWCAPEPGWAGGLALYMSI